MVFEKTNPRLEAKYRMRPITIILLLPRKSLRTPDEKAVGALAAIKTAIKAPNSIAPA